MSGKYSSGEPYSKRKMSIPPLERSNKHTALFLRLFGGDFMATARKTPSGNWRCLVYDYTDENGKRKYRSFTGPTKRAAELAAAKYANSEKSVRQDLTVAQAIDRYIKAKEKVLSVSTIKGYKQMQKSYYDSIAGIQIYKVTTELLQRFVGVLSDKVSAKSVANIYGLLSSALTMFRPDAVFRVSLPKKVKKKKPAPSNDQVQELFKEADGDLKISIALAAFGSLRRGEIGALKYGDITGTIISVHADMVQDSDYVFHYKEIPKTSDSVRLVSVPQEVIDLIGSGEPGDFILKCNPNGITHRFIYLRDKLGIDIRFHDLRHYYASIGAVIGVPDIYLSDFGGWGRNSSVMKQVYQNVIEAEKDRYQSLMTDYFSGLCNSKCNSNEKRARKSEPFHMDQTGVEPT